MRRGAAARRSRCATGARRRRRRPRATSTTRSAASSRRRCSRFAGAALLVGAFIIFNTFSITVAQRTREFALLRALGATRAPGPAAPSPSRRWSSASPPRCSGCSAGLGFAEVLGALFDAAASASRERAACSRRARSSIALVVGIGVTLLAAARARAARDARAARRRAARGDALTAARDAAAGRRGIAARRGLLGLALLRRRACSARARRPAGSARWPAARCCCSSASR